MHGNKKYLLIVTGTDPESSSGGIGFAMDGYIEAFRHANIEYISLPTYNSEQRNGKWMLWVKAIPKIINTIKTTISNGKLPIVYSHPGSGVSFLREGVIIIISKFYGARTVVQLHAPEIKKYLERKFQRLLLQAVLKRADVLCVLTDWWKAYLTDKGVGEDIRVIPNPLPPHWEQIANEKVKKKLKANTRPTILAMSRLEPGKGVDLVIEAMKDVEHDALLVVAGTGSEESILKKRVKDSGLMQRVEFRGWVSDAAKQELIDKSDLFCLPSSNDSFGMGFVEAMANGLPIVALDWGPISNVVPDGVVGKLVSDMDPVKIAQAINKLVSSKSTFRYGEQGKEWVISKFSAGKVGVELDVLFKSLTEK